MLEWVKQQTTGSIEDRFLHKGDLGFSLFEIVINRLVLVDSERALSTEEVRQKLDRKGVSILVFPAALAHILNPVELIISEIKRNYYRYLANRNTPRPLSISEQVTAIKNAYFQLSESSIRHCFKRCGLIGKRDPDEVMKSLLFEGITPTASYATFHDEQEKAYLKWKRF